LKILVCRTVHMCLYLIIAMHNMQNVSTIAIQEYGLSAWFLETPPLEKAIKECAMIWIAAQTAAVHGFLRGALSSLIWTGLWILQD